MKKLILIIAVLSLITGCATIKKLALKEVLPRAEKEIPELVDKELAKLVEEEYITQKVADMTRPVIFKVLKRLDDKIRIYLENE